MVISNVPAHSRFASHSPGRARWHRWKTCAAHAMVRVRGIGVESRLGCVSPPRRASRETTRVRRWREPRSTPRVVAIDVVRPARCGVARNRSLRWLIHRRFETKLAQISLATAAEVVAGRTTNEAALGVPERSLAVVARHVAGDV